MDTIYGKVSERDQHNRVTNPWWMMIGDVTMNKVKFDTRQEYEYVGNFKVLQNTFDKHK